MADEKISIDRWFQRKITISLGTCAIILALASLYIIVINFYGKHSAVFGGDKDTTGLEIGTLVRNVKTELMKADTTRIQNNERALFKLKDFQMEISFTVRSMNKEGASMDYKFVTVEGGTETGNEKVQKLTLRWEAIPETSASIGPADTSDIIIK